MRFLYYYLCGNSAIKPNPAPPADIKRLYHSIPIFKLNLIVSSLIIISAGIFYCLYDIVAYQETFLKRLYGNKLFMLMPIKSRILIPVVISSSYEIDTKRLIVYNQNRFN